MTNIATNVANNELSAVTIWDSSVIYSSSIFNDFGNFDISFHFPIVWFKILYISFMFELLNSNVDL